MREMMSSKRRYGIIALMLAAFMVTAVYTNAYAQYGGGGGPGAFTIPESFVGEGSGTNPMFNTNGVCFIENIELKLIRDGGTFNLSVFKITKPQNIPDAPDTVLYCRITVPEYINALIDKAIINISIPKSALMGKEFQLYMYNEEDGKWVKIPVTKVGEDANSVMYQAVLDHLSYFALTTKAVEEKPEMMFSKTFTVEGFDVNVKLTNGEVESINVNKDEKSLNLMLKNVEEDATLTIEIPRGLLDSKNPDGSDTEFGLIIDGRLEGYEETITDDKRILTIEVPAMTEEVTIIGTFVVPEFGIIAMMILAVGIASTLVAGRRYIKL